MKVITFHGLSPYDWIAWAVDNDVVYQIASQRIGRSRGRRIYVLVVLIDPDREVEVMLRWSEYIDS